jgi:hypothetical protein
MADMAERQLDRQAEQNHRMAELQKEVAEGAHDLVEADARAREEMVGVHRDLQAERSEVGHQRDALEQDRRDHAYQRHRDPIVAEAIAKTGLLLACVLPLILCWYLLHRRPEPVDDQAIAEVLLDDLVTERPLLRPSAAEPTASIASISDRTPRLPDASDPDVESEQGS